MFRRLLLGGLRVTVAVIAVFFFLWWFGVRMPGKSISAAASLSPDEVGLRDELIAGVLALARRFTRRPVQHTLRFVAFVNEEPPYFLTEQMGSFVYAGRCKARGDQISAMISLETIGYFSNQPHSQTYPSPGLGFFYPKVGNFIGFVANVHSRALLRRVIALFREHATYPSEGVALPSFVPGVSWSDQWSFWRNGYPGIMVTDTAPFRYPDYHSANDTPDKLDYDRFALVVSGMEKVIEGLDKL